MPSDLAARPPPARGRFGATVLTLTILYGCLYTLGALGLVLGTWSAGWIFDPSGSDAGALGLALAMAVLSPALLWMAATRRAVQLRSARISGSRA